MQWLRIFLQSNPNEDHKACSWNFYLTESQETTLHRETKKSNKTKEACHNNYARLHVLVKIVNEE